MLRLLRFMFTSVAIVMGLLCIAVAVIWVRSYSVGDGFVWKPGKDPVYYSTFVSMGRWRIDQGTYSFDRGPYFDRSQMRPPPRILTYEKTIWARLGFELYSGKNAQDLPHKTMRFPIWALAAALGVVPAIRLLMVPRQLRQRRRRKKGLCLKCGYDLRASEGRCPECGAGIAQSQRVACGKSGRSCPCE